MLAQADFNSKLPPVILILLAVLLWSTGGLFIKITSISGYEVNFGRCFFAVLILGLLTYHKGLRPNKLTLMASCFYVGALSFFALSNKMTTAANAIFLQYTAPIYVLIFSNLFLGDKFKRSDLFTVIICLAGMALFFVDSKQETNSFADTDFLGKVLGLLSGVFFGLYVTFLRHPQASKENPAISAFYGNLFAVLIMLPFVLWWPSAWTSTDFFAVFFLGVFQIGLAYYLFTTGVSQGVRPLDAGIIGFFEPLLNPVWVLIFYGERPSFWAVIGGLIIISAVLFHTIKSARELQKAK